MNYQLEPQLTTRPAETLYKAIAGINDPAMIAGLLRDLLTVEELEEAVRRFDVATQLNDGQTFRTIAARLQTSTATISRVNYWLHHGTGGYRTALNQPSG